MKSSSDQADPEVDVDPRTHAMRQLALHIAQQLSLSPAQLLGSRLFAGAPASQGEVSKRIATLGELPADLDHSERLRVGAHRLGEALDLLAAEERHPERRKTGSYFTPGPVARALVGRTLQEISFEESPSICDPACGGGAFLVEAVAGLAERLSPQADVLVRRAQLANAAHGIDLSPLAIFVTEVALWFLVGDELASVSDPRRFVVGNALLGRVSPETPPLEAPPSDAPAVDFSETFPARFADRPARGFDWIVGNPPWVAFQGRATQSITSELRQFYRAHFAAFRGYPTLHGLFVERATQIAPRGVITLLVPSSVSDLDGYRATRRTLLERHRVIEPLPEYGQDAFEGVVQPCFGLIAAPRGEFALPDEMERPFRLEERTHGHKKASLLPVPTAFERLQTLPLLPTETFREVGFQSNRRVATELFLRAQCAETPFVVPLLEGRNVREFGLRAPGLYLNPDERILSSTKCRLKPKEAYEKVDVVVRQTAAFTIAARHDGHRFRNSLLGAFGSDEVDADLLVGLLNSALFRALHVARQRDARQAAFPQVKVSHLRRLPAPPCNERMRERVRFIARLATERGGLDQAGRVALDEAVFTLFGLNLVEAQEVTAFLQDRAPGALQPSLNDD